MTESQWLASEDPAAMVGWLRVMPGLAVGTPSDRKLRLFACACFRACTVRPCDQSLAAVEVAEAYAEDASSGMMDLARRNMNQDLIAEYLLWGSAAEAVDRLLDIRCHNNTPNSIKSAGVLRDVVGNPYRTDKDQHWPHHKRHQYCTPDVLAIAQAAYDDRNADGTLQACHMLPLADSLEDAGCPAEVSEYGEVECPECEGAGEFYGAYHADDGMEACDRCGGRGVVMGDREEAHPLLAHLRSPGQHYRGCWVVDLILGKE